MEGEMFEQKKIVKNPLVPLGAMLTAGVLVAGLVAFKTGHSDLSQNLMRARVVAQGATVALMLGTASFQGSQLFASSPKAPAAPAPAPAAPSPSGTS